MKIAQCQVKISFFRSKPSRDGVAFFVSNRMSLVQRARHQLQLACQVWNRHGCVDLSAAFAFHSLQSFFPFLLVCLGVGARLFGQVDGASDQLLAVAAGAEVSEIFMNE